MCDLCAARDSCSRQAVAAAVNEPRFTKDHPRRVVCVTVLNAKRLPMTSDDGIRQPDCKFHLALFLNNQRVDVSIPVPARLPGDNEIDNSDDQDDENHSHGVAHWGRGATFRMEIDDDIHRMLRISLYRTDPTSIHKRETHIPVRDHDVAAIDRFQANQTERISTDQQSQSPLDHDSDEDDSEKEEEDSKERKLRAQKMLKDLRNVISMKNVYSARCARLLNLLENRHV